MDIKNLKPGFYVGLRYVSGYFYRRGNSLILFEVTRIFNLETHGLAAQIFYKSMARPGWTIRSSVTKFLERIPRPATPNEIAEMKKGNYVVSANYIPKTIPRSTQKKDVEEDLHNSFLLRSQ